MVTTYFLNTIADNVFRPNDREFFLPYSFYVGLSTTTPSVDGLGVSEPSEEAGYARVEITGFTEPVDGFVSNAEEISFPDCVSSWGKVSHFVIYEEEYDGSELLMYGPIDFVRTIEAGDIVRIKPGALKLSFINSR